MTERQHSDRQDSVIQNLNHEPLVHPIKSTCTQTDLHITICNQPESKTQQHEL